MYVYEKNTFIKTLPLKFSFITQNDDTSAKCETTCMAPRVVLHMQNNSFQPSRRDELL